MSVLQRRSQWGRLWLSVLVLCALFSIAAYAGWNADVKQVSDINPVSGAYPYLPTAIGDDLYFYADAKDDDQLFRTRGDVTVQLTNVYSDSTGIKGDYTPYLAPVQAGSSIFFASMKMWQEEGERPYEIWRVNEALPAGAELYWRSTGLIPLGWAQAGDLLYIRMRNGNSDELWMTDGGSGGLQLVKGGLAMEWGRAFVATGASTAFLASFTNSPVRAWFWRTAAGDAVPLDTLGVAGAGGYDTAVVQDDLYVTDGMRVVRVPAGSTQGAVVLDGGWEARIQRMYALGGKLFLIDAADPFMGPTFVLWRYDPAQSQLQRIGAYDGIEGMAATGDSAYFVTAQKENKPARLMRLPHSSAAAIEVKAFDAAFLVDGNSPSIAATNSMLYMQMRVEAGWELWGSDGTAAGTQPITLLWDMRSSQFDNCPCITPLGDTLYFDKMAKAKSVEMWRLNVTSAEDKSLYLSHIMKP